MVGDTTRGYWPLFFAYFDPTRVNIDSRYSIVGFVCIGWPIQYFAWRGLDVTKYCKLWWKTTRAVSHNFWTNFWDLFVTTRNQTRLDIPRTELQDEWDDRDNLTRTITIQIKGCSTQIETLRKAEQWTPTWISNVATRTEKVYCQRQVIVSAAIEDALEEQWHVVYDCASIEKDRERGGLVLWDGKVNPGHFCFDAEATSRLSPISQYKPTCGGGGLLRLGDCGEVYAGWDHTNVIGHDPTTYHYAELVYAHFHVHADNVDLKAYRCSGDVRLYSSGSSSKISGQNHDNLPTETTTASDYNSDNQIEPGSSTTADTTVGDTNNANNDTHHTNKTQGNKIQRNSLRPESTPSLGDIAAWVGYHRNLARAIVLTRHTSWLFFKWQVPGHAKNGIECPLHIIAPWMEECNRRRYESILLAGTLLREMARHGFVIYTRKLAGRNASEDGIYHLWDPSTSN